MSDHVISEYRLAEAAEGCRRPQVPTLEIMLSVNIDWPRQPKAAEIHYRVIGIFTIYLEFRCTTGFEVVERSTLPSESFSLKYGCLGLPR